MQIWTLIWIQISKEFQPNACQLFNVMDLWVHVDLMHIVYLRLYGYKPALHTANMGHENQRWWCPKLLSAFSILLLLLCSVWTAGYLHHLWLHCCIFWCKFALLQMSSDSLKYFSSWERRKYRKDNNLWRGKSDIVSFAILLLFILIFAVCIYEQLRELVGRMSSRAKSTKASNSCFRHCVV